MTTSTFLNKSKLILLLVCAGLYCSSYAQIIGWTPVPSPNLGTERSQLRAISGTSSTDIWAVGQYQTSPPMQQYRASNLISHWNGSNWQLFPPLDPTNVDNDLFDVEAIDTNNVWAVGLAGSNAKAQLLHYNGTAWSQVPLTTTANTYYLNSLDAISATDIWAVGGRSPVGTTLPYPVYTLHYNGSSWTEVPVTPLANGRHEFAAVDGAASNDVWGVGFWSNIVSYAGARFLAMHWNGSTWVNMNSTLPASVASQNGYFTSLKMIAPNDVWAIGVYNAGGYVMLHYDGSTWTEVAHPETSGTLAATPAGGLYSFGAEISHLTGGTWTKQDSLPQQDYPAFAGSVGLPNGEIWAAGRTVDSNNIFRTLVYRSVNSQPRFAAGSRQQWQAQQNATNSFNDLLLTSDSDVAQILTYRVVQAPVHGSLSGFPASAITGNGTAKPAAVSYIPTTTYNGIDSFTIEVSAGNISARTTIIANVSSSLPVVLTSFSAASRDGGVALKWSTITEVNTSNFIIEHSRDARSFTPITTIAAAGSRTGTVEYSFLHKQAAKGINYYRLTLADKDGLKTVFAVRAVTIGQDPLSLTLYPNPATDYLRVTHPTIDNGLMTIIDQAGRKLKVMKFTGSADTQLSLDNLAAGIYTLQVTPNNGTVITKTFEKK
jgi:hypothetical protein